MNDTIFETATLQVHRLGPGHEKFLQFVFEEAGDYFLTVTGRPEPDPDAAEREIQACEQTPGRAIALLTHRETGDALGAVGWWANHPEPDIALLGMLMIVPSERGKGYAREAVDGLVAYLADNEIGRVRTAVGAGDRAAHQLLEALGFTSLDARTHIELDRGRIMLSFFERQFANE